MLRWLCGCRQLHGINGGQEGVQDAAEDVILNNPVMLEALSNITYVLVGLPAALPSVSCCSALLLSCMRA